MNNVLSTAISGLNDATTRLYVSANNIANARTTGSLTDPQNAPYSALTVDSRTTLNGSVRTETSPRSPAFIPSFAPDSPFADDNGLIGTPNVNQAEELINAQLAKHAYQANAQIISTAKDLQEELIRAVDDTI
ncbi:MAG: flagellar basal body rod protein FlgC [Alphaproteobacteria bacterium]